METIRVGVIGVGHMGAYHARVYSELWNVDFAGVCDINSRRAEAIAKKYGVRAYTDYKKFLKDVDAVSIAVPTSSHYEVAKYCLSEGKCVLLEKPMTESVEDAEELISLAKENNLVLQVGHVERFNAAVQELRRLVKDPYFIDANRLGPYDPRVADVGVVMDLMIHDIDIILGLVNSNIVEINAAGASVYSKHEDIANIQIIFENGCIANITASRITENKERTLSITQKGIYIFLDYAEQDIHIYRQSSSAYNLERDEVRYSQESYVERLFIHKDNPLKVEIRHFLECVMGRVKPLVSLEEEKLSLKVALDVLNIINGNKRRRSFDAAKPLRMIGAAKTAILGF
ncbi:MAG: Gfo/Idh/MocA family oxidoreductase [bacterium]